MAEDFALLRHKHVFVALLNKIQEKKKDTYVKFRKVQSVYGLILFVLGGTALLLRKTNSTRSRVVHLGPHRDRKGKDRPMRMQPLLSSYLQRLFLDGQTKRYRP
ncbi:hypothetical protein BaRGS_00000449 [Batillaria attramentaria]|uniref:Uncharacterized protein n=1 Tax=Batillaria attramentaria TaxID=370345 RepID=A0ABD0M992_9CAEN